ncbi:hypothetical protein I2485_13335 [Nesterenkonia sp. E16_7]|uniref:hypothetical protein n=1 Tax=unclassified Nesterenkonia TaxID=2629769 RepID=UPI001A9159C7|nr:MULTISPECIES: hypothetical protein [unclassified Nesterenkonia]MBO0595776.1 hypothetical protein [Nesterenkonia sp. E16_10]MBO0599625.1 hypothetical protein [Nesterenkonia sp. E16_7]
MEKHSAGTSPQDAAQTLNALTDDRERLASAIQVPRALLAAFGGLAAWWVATAAGTTPGENYEPPTSGWLALVGILVTLHLIQRETGLRLRTMGSRAGFAVAGIIAVCLVLFSVSLGLVASGMIWVVALTSLTAFVTTTWLAGIAYRSAVDRLRHG